ncbi:MAG: DUF5615 family PIN-like protein [Anaerolineae bacterium]
MRLLLDSHLPRALAEQLRHRQMDCLALAEWLEGAYLDATDDALLEACLQEQRILVSGDCRTLPPMLKEWAESGRHHGGVVLIDGRGLRLTDVGALLRALLQLAETLGRDDWADRTVYLTRGQDRSMPTG